MDGWMDGWMHIVDTSGIRHCHHLTFLPYTFVVCLAYECVPLFSFRHAPHVVVVVIVVIKCLATATGKL